MVATGNSREVNGLVVALVKGSLAVALLVVLVVVVAILVAILRVLVAIFVAMGVAASLGVVHVAHHFLMCPNFQTRSIRALHPWSLVLWVNK